MLVLCHEFAECGPNSTVAQVNNSFNRTRGTLRGLHRQMPPYVEAKLVRFVSVASEVPCALGGAADYVVYAKPNLGQEAPNA
jgi:hypothetical protein